MTVFIGCVATGLVQCILSYTHHFAALDPFSLVFVTLDFV